MGNKAHRTVGASLPGFMALLLGAAVAIGGPRIVHAAGVVLDEANYLYEPSAPAEPDPAVWQKFGNISPIFGADSLVLVDPDSSSSLLYVHPIGQMPAAATETLRVTLRVPPISDASAAFDGDVAGGRVILDDGVKRAELQLARDPATRARIVSLGSGATGTPIPFKWDNDVFATYAILRAADGSMTVTITSSDPTVPSVSKTYVPGELAPTNGSAMFAFGSGEQGGGAFGFREVRAQVVDSALTVDIDIKPGSGVPPTINLGSAGVIPVAILSSATFDATQVDPASVSLAGAKVRLIGKADRYSCSFPDVNNDGQLDLLCHVETAQFFIETGESLAVLEAETFAGQKIRGEETIRIVP